MQALIKLLVLVGAVLILNGCQTVSRDQCQAEDWAAMGKVDAANGHAMDRFDTIAKDCGSYGITPDPEQYQTGWKQGVILYCTPQNGFNRGRSGDGLSQICPPKLAAPMSSAYDLGRQIYDARNDLKNVEGKITGLNDRIDEILSDLDGLDCDALNGDDRKDCRRKRRELKSELERKRFSLDDARWDVRDAQRRYDDTVDRINRQAAQQIPGFQS